MSLFSKVHAGATRLFQKVGGNDPHLWRKVSNTARKVDNSVTRVGNFLASSAHAIGAPRMVTDGALSVAGGVHAVRNNLEKAVNTPDLKREHFA